MFSNFLKRFLKTKATPHQVAIAFINFITQSGQSENPTSQALHRLSELSEKDRERVHYEIALLIGWINEYVTWDMFRHRPEKDAILTAYYSLIDDFAQKDPSWRAFDTELRKRIPVYAEAVKGGLQKPQIELIGETFAGFCGHPDNVGLWMIGSGKFAANHAATLNFLGSLKIVS